MTHTPKITTTMALLWLVCHAPVATSQTLRPTLDLASAQTAAQACERHAREKGWHMAIAVNDEAGRLKYFSRMDGAAPISVMAAQVKANTSSSLPLSTRQYRAAARFNEGAAFLPGITTVAGGLPMVDHQGRLLGSIGVSGEQEDQDETCAQAGLKALRAQLSDSTQKAQP